VIQGPQRLLLSGYYGYGNLGDEALLEVITRELKMRFPEAIVEVLSATPEETAKTFGVEATLRTDLGAVNEAIKRSDVLLSGGGGLLQNATSLKSLLYYAGILNTAARYKKKTMIFAQSIGPLDALGRRVVSRLCRRTSVATVRDQRSFELLQRLLPNVRLEKTGDPVFLYEQQEPDASIMHGLDVEAEPFAVFSVRRSAQSDKVTRQLARMVDFLATECGIQSLFIPFGGTNDAEIATTVIRRCRSKPMLLPEMDFATASHLIARSHVVVGMRLHALILAARHATPFLAFAYDPKVSALLEDLEYRIPPAWSVDPTESTADPMLLLDRVLDEHTDIVSELRTSTATMREAAVRNFTLLKGLLAS
jgi:polysaccharide pyruvyl transferase CsaB